MIKKPVYNTIGKTYDNTRQADPDITNKLLDLLRPKSSGVYLDIACGSGNYTAALVKKAVRMIGVDVSELMLNKASIKSPSISFLQGNALKLPFQDNSFNGACCILATHHIKNNLLLFEEAFRVLIDGNFVIFTATPEQMSSYWLVHYFPSMIEAGKRNMTSLERIQEELKEAGFVGIQFYPFFVTNQLKDLFLQAGKYRPEIYLDPEVRNGISSFHLSAYEEELEKGLEQLEADVSSGRIKEVIRSYENNKGDYIFIAATKE